MKHFLLIMFLMCVSGINAQVVPSQRHWQKGVKELRVISYNICDGFNGDQGFETERQDKLAEWLNQHNPDVVALQELVGFNQQKLAALAKRWGHSYVAILKENGYPVGITSTEPIQVKNRITANVGHGLLHAVTHNIDFLVTHLNPGNTHKRNTEAHMIIKYINDNKLTSCLLMGDMNSHSPFDGDLMEEEAYLLKNRYSEENLLNKEFDYSVISTFLSYPLIDVCRKFTEKDERISFPTALNMTQSENDKVRFRGGERIDFIFATPDLAVKAVDGFIWNGESEKYLSDHYPIGIDLLSYPQK